MKIYAVAVVVFLAIFAHDVIFQVVKASFLVTKEVVSTAFEVGQVLEETCDELRADFRETLDPLVSDLDAPTDRVAAAAVDMALRRPCWNIRRR